MGYIANKPGKQATLCFSGLLRVLSQLRRKNFTNQLKLRLYYTIAKSERTFVDGVQAWFVYFSGCWLLQISLDIIRRV
jgi:hypothetical protein